MEPAASVGSNNKRRTSRRREAVPVKKHKDRYWLHVLLFALTLASTVYMGGELTARWMLYFEQGVWLFILDGLRFGGSLLLFLTVHEFGHYFAAKHHGIDTSLPYYIPLPFVGVGTLGAVIRIREPVPSLRKLFDIGAAGPLAGFVVAAAVLIYAFVTLPPPTYILDVGPGHEALHHYVEQFGEYPREMLGQGENAVVLVVGDTLLYWICSQLVSGVPPMYEMYHYPVLFAGWLSLFFTALNLLPIGQLDGGHILYALFGRKWHRRLARGFFVLLLTSGAIGFMIDAVPLLYDVHPWLGEASWFLLAAILFFYLNRVFDGNLRVTGPVLVGIILLVAVTQTIGPSLEAFAYSGWLIWCLLLIFLVKVDHPPVLVERPLTRTQKMLGVASIIVFILCFSFKPLYMLNAPL